MSNTRAATAKIVYQPVTLAKKLASADVPALALRLLPHDGETRVTPRDVPMSIAAAQAAISGRTSAESYLTGAMRLLAAHAYGQDSLGALVKPLDPASRAAVTHAAGHLAAGAGIDANGLRMAAALAAQHILDLPIKPAAVKEEAAEPIAVAAPVADHANWLVNAVGSVRQQAQAFFSAADVLGLTVSAAQKAAIMAMIEPAAPVAAKAAAKVKGKAKTEPVAPVAAKVKSKAKTEPVAPVAAKVKSKAKPASMAAQLLAA